MKTLKQIKDKLQKASTLEDLISARIELIELNRAMHKLDESMIHPIAALYKRIESRAL
jgi:hypothetical protein